MPDQPSRRARVTQGDCAVKWNSIGTRWIVLASAAVLGATQSAGESTTSIAEAMYEKGWRDGAAVSCTALLDVMAAAKAKASGDVEIDGPGKNRLLADAKFLKEMKGECGAHVDWLWRQLNK